MKKLIVSVMLLSGVFVFAQETKTEEKKVEKTENVATSTQKTTETKNEAQPLKAVDPKKEAEIKAKKEAKKEE